MCVVTNINANAATLSVFKSSRIETFGRQYVMNALFLYCVVPPFEFRGKRTTLMERLGLDNADML